MAKVVVDTEPMHAHVPVLHRLLHPRRNVVLLVSKTALRMPFELRRALLGHISVAAHEGPEQEMAFTVELAALVSHFGSMLTTAQRALRTGTTTIALGTDSMVITTRGSTHTQLQTHHACSSTTFDNLMTGSIDIDAVVSLPRADLMAVLIGNADVAVQVTKLTRLTTLAHMRIACGAAALDVVKNAEGNDVALPEPALTTSVENVAGPIVFPHHEFNHLVQALGPCTRLLLGIAGAAGLMTVQAGSAGGEIRALLSMCE